jgi:hypothetical protein
VTLPTLSSVLFQASSWIWSPKAAEQLKEIKFGIDAPGLTVDPLAGGGITYMNTDVTQRSLTIVPSMEFRRDPRTMFPVHLDPSIAPPQSGRAMINQHFPTTASRNWTGSEGVGYQDFEPWSRKGFVNTTTLDPAWGRPSSRSTRTASGPTSPTTRPAGCAETGCRTGPRPPGRARRRRQPGHPNRSRRHRHVHLGCRGAVGIGFRAGWAHWLRLRRRGHPPDQARPGRRHRYLASTEVRWNRATDAVSSIRYYGFNGHGCHAHRGQRRRVPRCPRIRPPDRPDHLR